MARARLTLAAALSVSAVAAGCAGTHVVGAHRTVFLALTETEEDADSEAEFTFKVAVR